MKSIAIVAVATLMSPAVASTHGGFLMRPPIEAPAYFPDKPLSKWEQVASFDTATACESYKVAIWKEYKAAYEKARKETDEAKGRLRQEGGPAAAFRFEYAKGGQDSAFALMNATFVSRCVPANHITKK